MMMRCVNVSDHPIPTPLPTLQSPLLFRLKPHSSSSPHTLRLSTSLACSWVHHPPVCAPPPGQPLNTPHLHIQVKALGELKQQDLVDFFAKYLSVTSQTRRRICSHVVGRAGSSSSFLFPLSRVAGADSSSSSVLQFALPRLTPDCARAVRVVFV